MNKYILSRVIKSIIAIFAVLSIVIVMIFKMIPREKIFQNDDGYKKMKGDQKITYKYTKWEEFGYLDYSTLKELCAKESDDVNACNIVGSEENQRVIDIYKNKGYTFIQLNDANSMIAYRDYNAFELLVAFYSRVLKIDHPNAVVDPDNPDLERKYYVGLDYNGVPAIKCSGCTYKYQLYFDSSFPFIHQNAIKLDFGKSFPTKQGIPTLEVIGNGQGSNVGFEQTFPTGTTQNSPILQHTCKYKETSTLDKLDLNRFDDNYANCSLNNESPSMISTSYIFGILSIILAYIVALPAGIMMARKKGKLFDKLGIIYINFLIAIPSLAFIYFFKFIGYTFGLPDKFPQYGFGDIRSYILPVVILGLLSTSGLMMWMRRYMIDQSNADYVKFAKAKGLSEKEIFNNHILKNAIIPIVNGIPASIILAISGAVITESVFAIPGMGKMLPDAINKLNNNMVITLTFIFTSLSIFSVLLGDILMTKVDPRIKLAEKGD